MDAEAERIAGLGATIVRVLSEEGLDHYEIAMQDPEGNEFDIIDLRPGSQCNGAPNTTGAAKVCCYAMHAPLCRRHHQAKQTPGWQLTQDQPGHMTWRAPSGRIYATCPEPYPI